MTSLENYSCFSKLLSLLFPIPQAKYKEMKGWLKTFAFQMPTFEKAKYFHYIVKLCLAWEWECHYSVILKVWRRSFHTALTHEPVSPLKFFCNLTTITVAMEDGNKSTETTLTARHITTQVIKHAHANTHICRSYTVFACIWVQIELFLLILTPISTSASLNI